ncbi:MAG: sugar ABC transporter permease, partial [Pseudomonadota bacterium]
MTRLAPPTKPGGLAAREARLAWGLLLPTIAIVSIVIILPLLAIFWISFKPVTLPDLRPPSVVVQENVRIIDGTTYLEYRVRNSSQTKPITNANFADIIPDTVKIQSHPAICAYVRPNLTCHLGDLERAYSERIRLAITTDLSRQDARTAVRARSVSTSGEADNILWNDEFTLQNFARIFYAQEFLDVLWATIFYTVFGTIGALVVGLFAALLLNKSFAGQGVLRGMFLFPYVSPVIAVAFTWVTLFDPFSGSLNALLLQMQVIDAPINFFGERPLALIMVTIFEIWRYFPLSFLFI